jgi:hypothetical protein
MSARDQERPDLDQAARRTDASFRRSQEELALARRLGCESEDLAQLLAELNASNGFAELLVQVVVRGSV